MAGKYNKHKQDGSYLGFPIRMILTTVDLQVTSILSMNFESVQEKKFKTSFQDGHHSRNLGFPIATIWAIFHLQVTPMLPIKFWVNWPFSSEEERKNRFSRWPPSWISEWNDFSYFYIYKSSQSFLSIFKSTGALVQENKRKKRVSGWPPWWPSWIFDPNNFSYFRSTSPKCFLPSFESNGLSVQEKRKIDIQDDCHGGHLGFLIGMILAIFDLQVTLMLPT